MSKDFRPLGANPAAMSTPFGIFDLMLQQYFNSRLAVMQPVEVVSVSGHFANVRPVIAQFDTNGQKINITNNDVIPNIPIVQPFSAAGTVKIKVSAGDKGLLFAGNFDTTNYKKTHSETTVGSARKFNWSDGFFMPVDFGALPDGVLIQSGASEISVKSEEISITTTTLKINADVEITGDITATGDIKTKGDIEAEGDVDITGKITATDDIIGAGISVSTHKHGGVASGPNQTTTPV